jgi:hypothetical protein
MERTRQKRWCCDRGPSDRSIFVCRNPRLGMGAWSFCGIGVGAEYATFVSRKPTFAQHAAQVASALSAVSCDQVAQLAHVAQRFFRNEK